MYFSCIFLVVKGCLCISRVGYTMHKQCIFPFCKNESKDILLLDKTQKSIAPSAVFELCCRSFLISPTYFNFIFYVSLQRPTIRIRRHIWQERPELPYLKPRVKSPYNIKVRDLWVSTEMSLPPCVRQRFVRSWSWLSSDWTLVHRLWFSSAATVWYLTLSTNLAGSIFCVWEDSTLIRWKSSFTSIFL